MDATLTLYDLKLTEEQANFVSMLINVGGSGQHPVCTPKTFDYFYVTYLDKIIKKKNITKNMSEKGLKMFDEIKKILENL